MSIPSTPDETGMIQLQAVPGRWTPRTDMNRALPTEPKSNTEKKQKLRFVREIVTKNFGSRDTPIGD